MIAGTKRVVISDKNLRCYADCTEPLYSGFGLYSVLTFMYYIKRHYVFAFVFELISNSHLLRLPKTASVGTRFGLSV